MAKGKDRDTSLRGPLCAGAALMFQVDILAHPPTPLTLASSLRVDPVGGCVLFHTRVYRVCLDVQSHDILPYYVHVCGFWYVCRGVIFVLSVEGSGHHRRAFETSSVKIPGRMLARSIAG